MSEIRHKRGDTLFLMCTYAVDDVPTSLTGYTIAAQLRSDEGTLLDTLVVTLSNQVGSPGVFSLSASGATTGWALGRYRCDVQITSPTSVVTSSETFTVVVERDITQ